MPRIARIVVVGCPHHITQRGNNKQSIFFDEEDRWFYLNILKKFCTQCYTSILAYCLMPNHVHLLAIPKYAHSLAKTLQKVSLTYTQFVNKKYQRTGRLWECRFYSMPIEKESYLAKVCRYIERNPVRAQIVEKPQDYKWSSVQFRKNFSDECFINASELTIEQKNEYLSYLNYSDDEPDLRMIRKLTLNGKPLGSENFVSEIYHQFGLSLSNKRKGRPSLKRRKNRDTSHF